MHKAKHEKQFGERGKWKKKKKEVQRKGERKYYSRKRKEKLSSY